MKVTDGLATNGEQEKSRNGDRRCGWLWLRVHPKTCVRVGAS